MKAVTRDCNLRLTYLSLLLSYCFYIIIPTGEIDINKLLAKSLTRTSLLHINEICNETQGRCFAHIFCEAVLPIDYYFVCRSVRRKSRLFLLLLGALSIGRC